MTLSGRAPYTDLNPTDGVEVAARRLIDKSGAPIDAEEAHKYIRVIGSKLTNLEPHFWGEGMAIAKYPDARDKSDHYYITRTIKRVAITVRKRAKSEKDALRKSNFSRTSGLKKHLRKDGITPWNEIPEEYGRRRYLMFLSQEQPEILLRVGFSQSAIDACARGGDLGQPCDENGNPRMRGDKEVEFDVHHRIPLQAGGSNAIENLCLVDSDVHNPFFHKGDDPALNKMQTGEVREVALTLPRDDVHIIAVGLNAQVFVDKNHEKKGRAA